MKKYVRNVFIVNNRYLSEKEVLKDKFNYNIKFIIEVKLQSSVDSLFKRLEEFGLQIINHRFNCPNVNNFYVSIKCKNPLRPTVIE